MIYFDNNASTAIDHQVLDVMASIWSGSPSNPSSQHKFGRRAQQIVDDSAESILELLDAAGYRIIFTSGGTEANNWVVRSLGQGEGPVILSSIEHPSVLEAGKLLDVAGHSIRFLPVDCQGIVELASLDAWLLESPKPRLVSVMAANNETGIIQPMERVARSCIDAGVSLHCDATQAIGKIPFSLANALPDAVTIASHKFHGPAGVGALILRNDANIAPLLVGGAQQLGFRAGTEPVALIAGMSRALHLAISLLNDVHRDMLVRREALESALSNKIPHPSNSFFQQ